MDEIKEPKVDSQTSPEEKESTSKTTTESFTREDVDKAVEKARSDALAEAGRRYKPMEDENATLKSQLATNQNLIKRTEEKIGKLEGEIDELSKDDPDKLRLTRRLRELETIENSLKEDREKLRKEQEDSQERIATAEKYEVEIIATRISKEYEGGDADRLINLANRSTDKTESGIRAMADLIWPKKQPDSLPPIKPDSGETSGGTSDDAIRKAYRENPNDPKAYNDYQDYMRRKRGIS